MTAMMKYVKVVSEKYGQIAEVEGFQQLWKLNKLSRLKYKKKKTGTKYSGFVGQYQRISVEALFWNLVRSRRLSETEYFFLLEKK